MPIILIIDDEPIVRELLLEALEGDGRELHTAANYDDAIARGKELDTLDLAMVDKNLEEANGLDVIAELRQLHPDAEFILMTAFASLDSAVESVRLGLYDYIQKPFDLTRIQNLVKGAVANVRQRRDEAERQQATAEQLAHSEAYDQVTGLLNRPAFIERVQGLLPIAREDPTCTFAVLMLDLNDFGRINDSLGHTAGDHLLQQWGHRLTRLVRASDSVARLGADQFTVLLEGVRGTEEAMHMIERINRALEEPFEIAGRAVTLRASAGISISGDQYEHGEDLVRDAGTALVEAKAAGKATSVIFSSEMHQTAIAELSLDQGIRLAIDRGEFNAWYQPIVSLETETIVGFEALARWYHPKRGLLAPAEFLERAKEAGFLAEISWQVILQAFEQHRRWLDHYGDKQPLSMSVNIAPPLLLRPDFVDELSRLISDLGVPPSRLKAEVTEVVAIDNTELSAAIIQRIRRLGVGVCLDDFGTGFASLSWLHRFPVDELKIDQSFVSGMVTDRRSHILVGAAVSLAHSLGLPVVAEGVETQDQLDALRALAVEYAQGFLFAKPRAAEIIEGMMSNGRRARERSG